MPPDTYASLTNLHTATGKRVPPVSDLWQAIVSRWGIPARVVADRLRIGELRDEIPASVFLETRAGLWSEATADIRSVGRLTADGPLTRSRESPEAS